jgi:hypothetical protein
MSIVKIQGHASGTGTLTVTAPDTSTNRTLTLPDTTGTLLDENSSLPAANLTGTVADARFPATLPAASAANLTNVPKDTTVGGRKNMVINGAMQVSQRGDYTTATAITSHTYYLDRWQAITAGVTGTIQDTGFASKLVATSSATGSLRYRSKFEEITYLSSKIVTLSCQMKSNDANSRINMYADGWQSATATHTGGGDWESMSITLTLPAGITSELSAHIGIDGASSADVSITSGDYCEIKDVQLELGSTATDFEHRSYGEELALCQRYYQYGSTSSTYCGFSNGSSQVYFTVPLPTPLRISPTLSRSGSGTKNWTAVKHNGNNNSSTEPTVVTYVAGAFDIACRQTNHSGLSDMYATNIYASSYYIIFDAEL